VVVGLSTEQEISGAEREAMEKAWLRASSQEWDESDDEAHSFRVGWDASREFSLAYAEGQRMEYDDMSRRLSIALESEVACAGQRQRADMAEEREKKLRKRVEDLIIQLSKANDPINDYAVQALMIALGDA
jgi:hypothetical protein